MLKAKKSIIFLIDDLRSGGAQRQLIALAEGFKETDYKIEIIYYYPHFYYCPYLDENRIQHRYIATKGTINRIRRISKYLKTSEPDVVIAFMSVPALLAILATIPFKKWRLIIGERSSDPKILTSLKSRLIRLLYARADFVVANSIRNTQIVKKVNPFLPEKKIRVIYNTIDLQQYQPNQNYSFKKDNLLRIIVPASYRRLKNILGLIEVLSELNPSEKNRIRIDWFGDKSYGSHLDNVLAESEALISVHQLDEQIRLHDVSQHIDAILPEYDALGLFSFYEGLPNAVCEGMACGKPILCSAVSDLPILIEEEENGFLFDPNSVRSIKKAILKLLECPPERLKAIGYNNRKKAEILFDQRTILKQYKALIHE